MNAVKTIKRYGITCYSSFIIGSPQETKKDILSTLKFIEESQLDDFHINILTPLPGTPIWEYAKKRNLVSEDMNWEKLNIRFAENYEKAVILSEKLTRKELYELFLQFQKLRKRRRLKYIIKEGWEKPWKISKFLIKKLRSRLPMFTLKVKK
jgi:magnesium-protoporphyrin IX monomethyl ester (oxidative) cyclase